MNMNMNHHGGMRNDFLTRVAARGGSGGGRLAVQPRGIDLAGEHRLLLQILKYNIA